MQTYKSVGKQSMVDCRGLVRTCETSHDDKNTDVIAETPQQAQKARRRQGEDVLAVPAITSAVLDSYEPEAFAATS